MIFGAFLSMLLTIRFILTLSDSYVIHTDLHDVILDCINFFVH